MNNQLEGPMLDDLNKIAQIDADNALALAAGQSQQLLYEVPEVPEFPQGIDNIVVAGMGGSALAARLFHSWVDERLKLPFAIVQDYKVPGFVGQNTLVILSSYSGNTEETVAAMTDAEQRGAKIVVMASGGQLKDIAQTKGLPFLEVPSGIQPRMSTGYQLAILASFFDGLLGTKDELRSIQPALAKASEHLLPEVPTGDNQAKQIALELSGKTPIIYGSPLLSAVAYKWKINMNENAKNLAFYNVFSEHNHNEFNGWSKPVDKPFTVIELQSKLDNPRVAKRFEVTNRLLSGVMPKPIEVTAEGESTIEQILWTVQLGDFVSLYLAILNGINPTPVDLVEKLKKELA